MNESSRHSDVMERSSVEEDMFGLVEKSLMNEEWMDESCPEYRVLSTKSLQQGKRLGVKWVKGSRKQKEEEWSVVMLTSR